MHDGSLAIDVVTAEDQGTYTCSSTLPGNITYHNRVLLHVTGEARTSTETSVKNQNQYQTSTETSVMNQNQYQSSMCGELGFPTFSTVP